MILKLLGPVEILADGRSLDPGGRRQRIVLALLGLNANRVTSTDNLIEAVWGDAPPSTARGQIQICVSGLRRLFAEASSPHAITTRSPGYLLELDTGELDSLEFTSLVSAAKVDADAGRDSEAAGKLRRALRLWRGPALAGADSELVERGATVLESRWLAATEERIRLDIALGGHRDVCAELAGLVRDHPLRERLYELSMLALYRSGRQAEALETGRSARTRLVDELGVDPGVELQRLERAILNRDPGLDPPRPEQVATTGRAPEENPDPAEAVRPSREGQPAVPRQLPASIADFTGRRDQLSEITSVLAGAHRNEDFAVPVVAISGKGGVGKSSLAVRAAHELAGHYPDGHLYADLQAPGGDDRTPIVLARFLRALGVAGTAVPEDIEERAQMYRTKLADRRMVVVLDDASGAAQVRALLPGSPSCAVITTSRARLGGLPGAHFVDVDVFDMPKSRELLCRIIGTERVADEEEAAEELARLCAGLPLALRIAGARLASRPNWRISGLVHRIRDEARRLDELSHHGVELRSNIGLTYHGLAPRAQRLFRLFATVDAPDFPPWTAAALLDTTITDAEDSLECLVDAQLLDTVKYPGADLLRYRFHDLIRVYATERLAERESDAERHEAVARVLGGWLSLAELAHCGEYGGDYTIVHGTAPRWRPADAELADPGGRALDWWENERQGVVAAIRQAADTGMDELCWDLALTAVTLFETKGYFDDWQQTTQLALDVATASGNRVGTAAMLYSMGTLNMFQSHLTDAGRCFTTAEEIFRVEGNQHGHALVLRNAANIDSLHGDTAAMMAKYERSLTTLRAVGDRIGEAHVLRSQARYWMDEGAVEKASSLLQDALDIARNSGCLRAESQVLHRFSELHVAGGRIDLAKQELHQVLRIVRETGDRIGETHALYGLAVVQNREGRLDSAQATMMRALELSRRVKASGVEAKALHSLGELLLARGSEAAAESYLVEAKRLFTELGSTVWLARTLLVLSDVLSVAGDGTGADTRVREAVGLLSEADGPESRRLLAALDTTKPG